MVECDIRLPISTMEFPMNRVLIAAIASTALVLGADAAFAASPTSMLIADEPAKPLTLASAKASVTSWIASVGRGNALRAGKAVFDGAGNVNVELVSIEGLPLGHVLVHATDGRITDARTGAVLGAKG